MCRMRVEGGFRNGGLPPEPREAAQNAAASCAADLGSIFRMPLSCNPLVGQWPWPALTSRGLAALIFLWPDTSPGSKGTKTS